MKICVAQAKPVKGNIETNIENHKKLIAAAITYGADTIIFPELSITGYEPSLAKDLAIKSDDKRFDDFQQISDASNVLIGVGVPTKNDEGTCITMLIFQPQKERQTYSKKYLHDDEKPFFICGTNATGLTGDKNNIAIAICFELTVADHAKSAFESGAEIYIASVAKTAKGVKNAAETLSAIAAKYAMTVLLSNCVGEADGEECGGHSAAWNNKGELQAQLNDVDEGFIILDTATQEVIVEKV